MTQESLGMHIALWYQAGSTTSNPSRELVGKWHTRSTKEKRFVTIEQVLGSEEVSVLVETLESQLELGDVGKAPRCLSRERLPSTHTCYVPPLPRFRNLLQEIPEILCRRLLYHAQTPCDF
jgi:hypothetical protein